MTASDLEQHSWERIHGMMEKHGMENHSHSEGGDTEHSEMS